MCTLIWLDISGRSKHLSEIFGEQGNWLTNTDLTPESSTHIVLHATDFCLSVNGNSKPAAYQRIESLRKAINSLDVNAKEIPSIFVYSGYSENEAAESVKKETERVIPNLCSLVQYIWDIDRYREDVLNLKIHLTAKSKNEAEKAISLLHQEMEIESAISLVAEVIAWLNETSPPKLKGIAHRLKKEFGPHGEELESILERKLDISVKERVRKVVDENRVARIRTWKKVGMLSSTDESEA